MVSVIIGAVLILAVVIVMIILYFRFQSDNRRWLEMKSLAEYRLARYDGSHTDRVATLVSQLGHHCEQIAAGVPVFGAKRGLVHADRCGSITSELIRLRFFEQTDIPPNIGTDREDPDANTATEQSVSR